LRREKEGRLRKARQPHAIRGEGGTGKIGKKKFTAQRSGWGNDNRRHQGAQTSASKKCHQKQNNRNCDVSCVEKTGLRGEKRDGEKKTWGQRATVKLNKRGNDLRHAGKGSLIRQDYYIEGKKMKQTSRWGEGNVRGSSYRDVAH